MLAAPADPGYASRGVTETPRPGWPEILRAAGAALGRELGRPVALGEPAPMIDGWTARHGEPPCVRRCVVSGLAGRSPTSVVVKTTRPAGDVRGGDTLRRERAALTLLAELGSNAGPRLFAHGEGFLVLEDLGRGPAVEDLLVGDDPAAATEALVALATAVGAMQAATHGREDAFHARLAGSGIRRGADRRIVAESTIERCWATLGEFVAAGAGLPPTRDADADIEEMTAWLADPGPLLALSTGDLAPQNCRVAGGAVRLLDFERASFRHVMLDTAQLRLPFCGAPCWGRLPFEVTEAMESAFRTELARTCPAVLAQRTYRSGMATATAAWAVTRLVRLPKLVAQDEPHPMGFSRRGQLLDTIQSAIDAAGAAGALPALRSWFEHTMAALRRIWPGLPPAQDVYPAFRGHV